MRGCDSMLLPVPAPGACSTAAPAYSISELPTRLSPSLPAPALPPGRAHCKAGPHAAVFFSPASPPSISAVREFSLRCPLLIPTIHYLSTICINIVNGGLLKGNERAGYQRDVPWAVSGSLRMRVRGDPATVPIATLAPSTRHSC